MRSIISALVLVAMAAACAAPSPTGTQATSAAPTVAAATTTPSRPTAAPSTAPRVTTGTITGFAGYPAEGHPAMTIYAVSTTDRRVFFSVAVPRAVTPPKSTYTVTGVLPGTYHLFSYLEGSDTAGGAYSEFVTCGLRAGCPSHKPIDVTVRAGETVREIDVTDWYAPPGTFPTRPR